MEFRAKKFILTKINALQHRRALESSPLPPEINVGIDNLRGVPEALWSIPTLISGGGGVDG